MQDKLFLVPFGYTGATRVLLREVLGLHSGTSRSEQERPGLRADVDFADVCYIAPTPRKARAAQLDFASLILSEPQPRAVVPPVFETLRQFATRVWAEVGTRRRLAPELRPLLLMRLMREKRPGWARAVADFIKLIREYRPDLEPTALTLRLKDLLADYQTPCKRLLQAVRAMERYRAVLEQAEWIDDEGIFECLASNPIPLPSPRILCLDGFYDLTRLEERFLARIIRNAGTVLGLGYGDARAFRDYQPVRGFREFLKRVLPGIQEIYLPLERKARHAPPCLEYSSREDEVEGIARDLKLRLLAGRVAPSSVMVVFPNFVPYAPLVQRIFADFGIPCTVYPELNLAASPLLVAARQLFAAVRDDFPRIPFVAALASPFFARVSDECRTSINRLSLQAGLIKGAASWRHLTARLRHREISEPDSEELLRASQIQEEVSLVLGLCHDFGRARNTLAGYARDAKALLVRLEFGVGPAAATGEYRRHRRMLYDLLDSLVEFEAAFGEKRITLDEFCTTLEYLLGGVVVQPEADSGGVLVLSTLESRGLDCELLYYGGLNESDLPSRFRHDPLLPDRVRQALGLPCLERHLQWQRLHFFRLVNTPVEDPVLSFPDTDEDTILLPSPFLEGKLSFAPLVPGIFTAEDRQRRLGRENRVRLTERLLSFDLRPDPAVRAELERRFGQGIPISVTKLEKYGDCPFRFYLEQILGVSPATEPKYQLEPARWGSIFHSVLERLYAKGAVPLVEIPDRVRRILPGVMREAGLPAFWQLAITRVFEAVLPELVRLEEASRNEGFEPIRIEHYLCCRVAPDLLVKGRIDRVDRGPAGVRITDYKTGKVRASAGAIQRGEHIQLPLYALMWQQCNPEMPVANFGILSLNQARMIWLANDENSVAALIQLGLSRARELASQIRAARFAETGSRGCWCCDYEFLCPDQNRAQGEAKE